MKEGKQSIYYIVLDERISIDVPENRAVCHAKGENYCPFYMYRET